MPSRVRVAAAAAVVCCAHGAAWDDLVAMHYPQQYVVAKLQGEGIAIDGDLNDSGWAGVPWLDDFLDLAGPRYAGKGAKTWEEASREYAARFTGEANPTKVKMRYDDRYVYVGAELTTRQVAATVTGHCDELKSDVWSGTPVLPYFDDDFEVFINPSQDNYYYTEFEMSARNATYSTLWSLPQAGLGSVAPECGGGDSPRATCCNTTWNSGKGLCDKPPVETEAGSWTFEMFDPARRPGTGMASAAKNNTKSWTLEIRFPILSTPQHGGVVNVNAGGHFPGTDPTRLDPNNGQRYWWATFANALHAPWWAALNTTTTKEPEYIKGLCAKVIGEDKALNGGYSQFLVDANNAAPTCYYEAASQHLAGHQYMHNPDVFGYLEFSAPGAAAKPACRNVLWPARFVLAQLYQAQVQHLTNVAKGNGAYAASVDKLLDPAVCTIDNACNATALAAAMVHMHVEITADEHVTTGHCAQYAIGTRQIANWTGGPCFTARVSYTVTGKRGEGARQVSASIDEARLLKADKEVGQQWNADEADWLCLDNVAVTRE
eukprot:TRINITY_DN4725_c0_g1_i1.p1 TRINITY_DN4725_c0_g1~~TRINITY_DN4725_c0_g1_i1.p1  ORF type:complete len:546 (+),score=181.64 TRINITY_DN4725_c0_g1_i1:55-1692(+)